MSYLRSFFGVAMARLAYDLGGVFIHGTGHYREKEGTIAKNRELLQEKGIMLL
jgi:hypothetical protein